MSPSKRLPKPLTAVDRVKRARKDGTGMLYLNGGTYRFNGSTEVDDAYVVHLVPVVVTEDVGITLRLCTHDTEQVLFRKLHEVMTRREQGRARGRKRRA